MHVQGVLILI